MLLIFKQVFLPFDFLDIYQNMFDRRVDDWEGGVEHGDVVTDDAAGLVPVQEQPAPRVRPHRDVGEQVARLHKQGYVLH